MSLNTHADVLHPVGYCLRDKNSQASSERSGTRARVQVIAPRCFASCPHQTVNRRRPASACPNHDTSQAGPRRQLAMLAVLATPAALLGRRAKTSHWKTERVAVEEESVPVPA